MRANSLALRLFLSATAWTVIILLVTGVVLSSLYRQAVERAFDRRLGVYLRTLVADIASPEEAGEKFPQSLGEPLFELPLSGWYWQVTRVDPGKTEVRSSRSLWDGGLPHLRDQGIPGSADGSRAGYVGGPEDQRLRLVERNVDLGEEGHYLVAIAGDAAEISDETRSFDKALIITFSILTAVLLLTTTFQVRFGLAPLKRITDGLDRHSIWQCRASDRKIPRRDRSARSRDERIDRDQQGDCRAGSDARRKSGACAKDPSFGDGERGHGARH